VRLVVEKVALGQVFIPVVLFFFAVSIIPPMLHNHLHLYVVGIRRMNGRGLGNFQNAVFFRKWRIVLRWIFRKWEGVVGIGWSWLRIGTGGGHL
jgi:hypothetical protein